MKTVAPWEAEGHHYDIASDHWKNSKIIYIFLWNYIHYTVLVFSGHCSIPGHGKNVWVVEQLHSELLSDTFLPLVSSDVCSLVVADLWICFTRSMWLNKFVKAMKKGKDTCFAPGDDTSDPHTCRKRDKLKYFQLTIILRALLIELEH